MGFDPREIAKDPLLRNLALDVLAAIATIVHSSAATTAITVIRAILSSFDKAVAGTVTPDRVRSEMQNLLDAIRANDSAADAALKAKFDKP